MTGVNAWHVLRKDLGVGPRSPIFLYAIVLPVILTLLIRVVFGSLFDPVPRLGIVDEGESQDRAERPRRRGYPGDVPGVRRGFENAGGE